MAPPRVTITNPQSLALTVYQVLPGAPASSYPEA